MPGGGDGRGLVVHQQVDHAVAVLHVTRPDLLRPEDAQAAAFHHGRPAHADVAVPGCDDHVAASQQRRVAGEAAARHDADHRRHAIHARIAGECGDVQAGDDRHVGVAGPAAPAFGEQHDRQPVFEGDAEHAVGLLVVAHALRAGQHGGVVGHHDGARSLRSEQLAVDAADASDHAVRRRVAHQVFRAAAAALRGHGQRAVFDERAGVAKVGDVLARGALSQLAAPRHRVRARRVEHERVAIDRALQVGAMRCAAGCFGGGRSPSLRR